MDFETKLKYLDVMYQSKELQYTIDSKKEIDYYSLFYIEMKVLLEKNIGSKNVTKENVRIFIDNLDIILKYTNGSNMEWIYYTCIYDEPDFIEKFTDNIDKMRFKHHVCFLVARICNVLNEKNGYKELLSDRMIDKLMSLPCPYAVNTYGLIFDKLDNAGRLEFIKMALEKGKKIDFSRLNSETFNSDIIAYIKSNALQFAINSLNIFALRDLLGNDKNVLDELDNFFVKHQSELAHLVMQIMYLNGYSETIQEIVYLILLDIIKNENAKLSDITWRFGGSYSNLLFIGNKVFKYGDKRATRHFPNNPYIIKPLLRKDFIDDDKELFVEVVEIGNRKEVTEEEMYELYKNFRNLNLIWRDVKKENVGFLNRDNIIYWNGNLDPSDEVLGLLPYRGPRITLNAGDVVLLDADDIYDLEDDYVSHNKTKYFDDFFEKRYQNEMKLVKKI